MVLMYVGEDLGSLQTVLVVATGQSYHIIVMSSDFQSIRNFKSIGQEEVK